VDVPFWVRFADNRYGLELSAMQYGLTLLLEGGRLCHASGERAAHRQAFLGAAVSSICWTSSRSIAVKTVSAMYALDCHNLLL
jgi:hypothetical protein